MDEGKAAEPKPKWWSRPRRTPDAQPGQGSGPVSPPESGDGSGAATTEVVNGPGEARATDEVAARTGAADSTAATAPSDAAAGDADPSAAEAPAAAGPASAAPSAPEPASEASAPATAARPAADGVTPVASTPGDAVAAAPAPAPAPAPVPAPVGAPDVPQPRHAPDPYGTPPYGQPGPWAPAPPVQHPATTPAHGTPVPSTGALPAPGQLPPPAPESAGPPAVPDPVHLTGPTLPTGSVTEPNHHAPPVRQAPPAHHTTPAHGTRFAEPAGPVQTPAHGTVLPAPTAQGAPGTANSPGQWQSYDPWAASPVRAGAVGHAAPPALLEPPRRASRRGSLLIGAVLLALVAGGIGGGIGAYIERNGGFREVELPQAAAEPGDRARDPESVAGIAGAALPGVVTLHVDGAGRQGTGTGFVLDQRGHILTNNHVVEPAAKSGGISVTFSGGEVARGEIVGRDAGYDLAVVRVRGVSGLKPLPLGNSDAVRVGDPVVAIGAPFDLAGTVTTGIISAKERPITAGGEKGDGSDISYVDALQTDAPINPGNSGGPLVDSRGRVIGINSAIRAADSGSGNLEGAQGGSIGLGFAIPVNQGKRVAEELINTGRATHPVIGVTLDLEYSGDGARVRTKDSGGTPVKPGGPGDKAGIAPGDVITEVDGARVHNGEELIVKIRSHRPGDRLELTLERDGEQRSLELTLGSASGG
ncbi:trypsin-like peptidase domain-containing protein [Streptomyces sp. NPDC047108]|uniref:trypsin-like peptidase domain-containing protein n=1 Tax=Streptomyces sp. NPDC047108 TaxID=3155025 RepID=UPI0033CA9E38